MGVPTIKTGPMTVGEFYAFTDTRPDEEKWELIDGEPILNASPHQTSPEILGFVGNLRRLCSERHASSVLLGKYSRVWASACRTSTVPNPTSWSFREPAVLIANSLERDRSDVIVALEILSPSTRDRDLRWKRDGVHESAVAHPLCRNRAGCD